MKINSFNSNNVYNKPKKDVSKKKDASVLQSEKTKAPYNVAFYGLFVKKPFDGTVLFNPVSVMANEEYLITPETTFFVCNKFVTLKNYKIADCIEKLEQNQRLYIDNKENNPESEDYLCIRKDAQGQLLASASGTSGAVQILPNVIKLNPNDTSCKLDPAKYYEIPENSVLALNEFEVDLSNYKDKLLALKNGEKLTIGRSDDVDIQVEDEYISRYHCSIEKRADKYLLKDLNSTNGTKFLRVADTDSKMDIYTLPKGEPVKVPKDSQIYLGDDFAIDLRNKNILNLLYEKGNVIVGRSQDADIVVPEFYNKVSRVHLNIALHNNEIYVTDLNSKNDTQVIPKNKIKPFYQGVENIELRQGNIGDCYLLSSLYALSKNPVGQKLIENMVKVDDEGNYVVSFPDRKPIKVPLEQLDGQKLGDKEKICVAGELGVRAIERAYGKMLRPIIHSDKTLFMNIDNGGKISETLFNLSGIKSKNYYVPNINVNQKFAELAKIPMEKHVMLCGSHQKGQFDGYVDPQKKFIAQHAYAIKGFDVDRQLVEIVNPHNTKKSEFVSFQDFQKMFASLYVLDI